MQPTPAREIDLDFADGAYTFALPAMQLAELQTKRGWPVSWPDGSTGQRPKPFGLIWREHLTGEYDPNDCREIVRLGLIGGGQGLTGAGVEVKVSSLMAETLMKSYFDPMPTDEQWKLATSILVAVCQGYTPPPEEQQEEDSGGSSSSGNAEGARTDSSTSPASSATAAPAA